MIKKPNSKYESPMVKVFAFDVDDIVATSNTFVQWDWKDESGDDGWSS